MKTKEIVVTVSCLQPSEDDQNKWVTKSRIFSINRPIADMLSWARNEGCPDPKINDLILSEYTGSSI